MPDLHYENPELSALYELDSGWSADLDFYLALAGGRSTAAPKRILDLGCGTGLLANAYAALGHAVTAVDPAQAMLDVARRKPNGEKVEWVQSSAQAFRSDQRFDLIVMTGHAFQVLLEDDDILATFATMRKHLAPGGRIVFETRNPTIDWRNWWVDDIDLPLDGMIVRESRRFLSMENNRMSFELHYSFPNKVLVSASELLFLPRTAIEERLTASGLQVENVLGDWDGRPFDAAVSHEMIFTVRGD